MKSIKKKILLCWPTDRKDLMQPFIDLSQDFDFVFLWGDKKEKESEFNEIYFLDYANPYRILREVKPDKILFFNIDSFPQVALNMAARNRGIVTYTMHHGIYSSNELEIAKEKETQASVRINNLRSVFFYFSAIRLRNLTSIKKIIQFGYLRKRRHTMLALSKCVFEERLANQYIQLSEFNSQITKKLNGFHDNSRFRFIGHPFFDHLLKTVDVNPNSDEAPYYLLIDFPNVEGNLAFRRITHEKKVEFYKKLSEFAGAKGSRLKIKLHPAGYDSPYNYEDDNIDLVYEDDIRRLISNAIGCFAFYSSLLVPLALFNRCYVIDFGIRFDIQQDLIDLNICRSLNLFSLDISQIDFSTITLSQSSLNTFIERYLFKADGKATERLKTILAE